MSELSMYIKCIKVVGSCNTTEQLNSASKYVRLAYRTGEIATSDLLAIRNAITTKKVDIINAQTTI